MGHVHKYPQKPTSSFMFFTRPGDFIQTLDFDFIDKTCWLFHFIDSKHVAIPVYTRLFSIKSAAKHLASCTWGLPTVILPTNPPFNLLFFPPGSARFPPGFHRVPPGSARFRRVPPGSAGSAGFRWVLPLPPGAARFRWVPGFASSVPPGCAGFCRVSANKVPAPGSPFNLLLGLCKVLARRLPRLLQSKSKKRFLQMPGHCASQLMEKNTDKIASLIE